MAVTTPKPAPGTKSLPSVQVPQSVYDFIAKEAETEERPLTNHLRRILRQYVEAATSEKPGPAERLQDLADKA